MEQEILNAGEFNDELYDLLFQDDDIDTTIAIVFVIDGVEYSATDVDTNINDDKVIVSLIKTK